MEMNKATLRSLFSDGQCQLDHNNILSTKHINVFPYEVGKGIHLIVKDLLLQFSKEFNDCKGTIIIGTDDSQSYFNSTNFLKPRNITVNTFSYQRGLNNFLRDLVDDCYARERSMIYSGDKPTLRIYVIDSVYTDDIMNNKILKLIETGLLFKTNTCVIYVHHKENKDKSFITSKPEYINTIKNVNQTNKDLNTSKKLKSYIIKAFDDLTMYKFLVLAENEDDIMTLLPKRFERRINLSISELGPITNTDEFTEKKLWEIN